MAVMSATHAPAKDALATFPSFEDQSAQAREYWLKVHPGGEPQVSELIVAFRGLSEFVDEITVTPRQLSTIESRTLVVIGDRDPLVPVSAALEMYEAIPAAALWVIPMQGHSAMWPDWGGSAEAASILPDVLTRFLGSEPLEAPPKQ
jgi:pimeloyl-ACP methyl ester carboxylesterase